MKTTNYETSKKLKEAGFEAESEYYWHSINDKIELLHVARAGLGDVKAYDLETLLDALTQIQPERRVVIMVKSDIRELIYGHHFNKCRKENESFADAASRLWLLLKEKGLV